MKRHDWIAYLLILAIVFVGFGTCGIALHVLGLMAGAQGF